MERKSVFLDAIEEQTENLICNEACIDFYINTDQEMEIRDFWMRRRTVSGRPFPDIYRGAPIQSGFR